MSDVLDAPPALRDLFLAGQTFPDHEFLVYEDDRERLAGLKVPVKMAGDFARQCEREDHGVGTEEGVRG